MRFIEGIGYVDDTQALNSVKKTDVAKKASASRFDDLLADESEKLQNSGSKVYNLKEIFAEAAEKYKVPQELLEAVGYHESRFQAGVTSSAGAMGIMQLMPGTAQAMGVKDGYDPYDNIMGGAKLLGYLYDVYDGDLKLTLAAYSAGTGSVAKYNGVPPFEETENFIKDIFEMLKSGESYLDDTKTAYVSEKQAVQKNAEKNKETDKNIFVEGSLYNSLMLDDRFTYSEYEMLMEYYTNMLKIISNIGDTDSSDDSDDDSLTDLFKLSMKQRMADFNADNRLKNISETQMSKVSMSDVAAKYMAVSNMF